MPGTSDYASADPAAVFERSGTGDSLVELLEAYSGGASHAVEAGSSSPSGVLTAEASPLSSDTSQDVEHAEHEEVTSYAETMAADPALSADGEYGTAPGPDNPGGPALEHAGGAESTASDDGHAGTDPAGVLDELTQPEDLAAELSRELADPTGDRSRFTPLSDPVLPDGRVALVDQGRIVATARVERDAADELQAREVTVYEPSVTVDQLEPSVTVEDLDQAQPPATTETPMPAFTTGTTSASDELFQLYRVSPAGDGQGEPEHKREPDEDPIPGGREPDEDPIPGQREPDEDPISELTMPEEDEFRMQIQGGAWGPNCERIGNPPGECPWEPGSMVQTIGENGELVLTPVDQVEQEITDRFQSENSGSSGGRFDQVDQEQEQADTTTGNALGWGLLALLLALVGGVALSER